PGGAASEGTHVLRASGEARRPQPWGRAARLFDQRKAKGRRSGDGAEGAADQCGVAECGAGGGVVRPALAGRAVLQGTEGDAGAAPLPFPRVPQGGKLGASLPGG